MEKKVIKNSTVHFITLSGENNFEIGKKHGELLKIGIKHNIDFYLKVFNQKKDLIEEISNTFGKNIANFNKEYEEEIHGIASGAGVPIWQIYMLNARSEIFSILKKEKNEGITECTLFYFKKEAIIAENWDWALAIGAETYVFNINKKNTPKIITLSEAGILAKIGLNENGIGVGMNFLEAKEKPTGVPIHILIRQALEKRSFDQAYKVFQENASKVSGNVCLGDKNGSFVNFEFDGSNTYILTPDSKTYSFCHTNHFLGKDDKNKVSFLSDAITSTSTRFLQAEKLITEIKNRDESSAKSILENKSHDKFPILVPKTPSTMLGEIGTIASLVISLKEKKLSVAFAFEDFKRYNDYYLI